MIFWGYLNGKIELTVGRVEDRRYYKGNWEWKGKIMDFFRSKTVKVYLCPVTSTWNEGKISDFGLNQSNINNSLILFCVGVKTMFLSFLLGENGGY